MPDSNGSHASRAELRLVRESLEREVAHVANDLKEFEESVAEDVKAIRGDLHEIHTTLGAGPRWLGARANAVIDKLLPTVLAIAALWVLSGRGAG